MPGNIDFSAFSTGTPVWRIRVNHVPHVPARITQDIVLCVDSQNHRLTTKGFPEETTAFYMENPADGYLYMSEPIFNTSWLLFQQEQDAAAYLERQELLIQVWDVVQQHRRLRQCSTAQLRALLDILNNPQGDDRP